MNTFNKKQHLNKKIKILKELSKFKLKKINKTLKI